MAHVPNAVPHHPATNTNGMASFLPINVYEEDIKQDAEEHTRELQIEEGYKVFQQALQHQNDNKNDLAREEFEKLFKIEVMTLDASNCPKAAEKLKYLASKNYVFLLLSDLKAKIDDIDGSELRKELEEEVLFEISEALEYDTGDPAFLEFIYKLSLQLGFKREARLALEAIVYSQDRATDLEESFINGQQLTPQEYKCIINLRKLVADMNDFTTLERNPLMIKAKNMGLNPKFMLEEEDFSWLTSKYDLIDNYDKLAQSELSYQVNVNLTKKDWKSVIESLDDSLAKLTKSKKKKIFEDAYLTSDSPANVIKFDLPVGLVEESTQIEAERVTEEAPKKRRRKSEHVDNQRSSKRVRNQDQPLTFTTAVEEEEFLDQFNGLLKHANVSIQPVIGVFTQDAYEVYHPHDQLLVDFKSLLIGWDDPQRDVFLPKETRKKNQPQVMQLLEVAALGDSEPARPAMPVKHGLEDFLVKIRDNQFHAQETRLVILESLFTGEMSILSDNWPQELLELTRTTVLSCEPMLYQQSKSVLTSESCGDTQLQMALAVSEIFVDVHLAGEKKARNTRIKNEDLSEVNKLRMELWLGICGDLLAVHPCAMEFTLRHEWAVILSAEDPVTSLALLEEFKAKLEISNASLYIEFANFETIPALSLQSVSTQISKFRAASVFAAVFEKEDGTQSYDRIAVLESILMPKEHPSVVPEHEAIVQFLSTASLEFRLQLWYLLLDAHDSNGQSDKSFDGYLRILISSIDEFGGESYDSGSEHQRSVLLLRSLNVCLDISRKLVKLAMDDETLLDNLSPELQKQGLDALLKLLRVLRVYVLLNDAITSNSVQKPNHPSWQQAENQFKELVLRSWALMYFFYKKALPEQILRENTIILDDVLSLIHEEVGNAQYCGHGNGFFLKLCLREMEKVNLPDETRWDMLQCLHCRYGFTMAYDPNDHHSTPVDLDRSDSLELIGFIMDVILSHGNILQILQRSDVRAVLEELHESLGNLNKSQEPAIAQNRSVLKGYFENTFITAGLLQDALSGRLGLTFFPCQSEIGRVGKSGFYYIQGLSNLTQYKQRAKQNLARHDEIEQAIEYFQFDLMCNTNRFESWFGLAECYDAMATMDLSINADKINSPELRTIPSSHQRKSIAACSMAICVNLQHHAASAEWVKPLTQHYQQQVANLWPFFARVLFYASRSPMNMEAFSVNTEKLYYNQEGNLYNQSAKKTMSEQLVWRVADQCLKIALNTRSPRRDDWSIYHTRSKVLNKLGRYNESLDCLTRAVELAESDTKHEILEPPYKLVSMCYKYVRKGHFTAENAMALLQKSSYSDRLSGANGSFADGMADTLENQFYLLCVHTLQRIKHSDRRHDLHRPSYRLAKIFDQVYNNVERAKEEMAPFFSKGSSNKPISIWKHEHERPGQHYEYMYEYIVYYTELLGKTDDYEQLALLLKRLRRFNGSMAKRPEAWDYICQTTAKTTKHIMGIGDGYSDTLIMGLPAEHFEQVTTELHDEVTKKTYTPKLTDWLLYGDEKKKLNNGLGSTSQLDDLFVSIYLKVYQEYISERPKFQNMIFHGLAVTPDKHGAGSTSTPNTPNLNTPQLDGGDVEMNDRRTPPPQSTVPVPGTPSTPKQQQTSGHDMTGIQSSGVHIPPKMRATRKLIMIKGKELVKVLTDGKKATGVATELSTPIKAEEVGATTPQPGDVDRDATPDVTQPSSTRNSASPS